MKITLFNQQTMDLKIKIRILIIFFLVAQRAISQTIYTNKQEFEKASLWYEHALFSYQNSIKKIEYYAQIKYPKRSLYPANGDEWFRIFEPGLNSKGIKIDNNENRLFPDVEPEGPIYFNFIEDPEKDNLIIRITSTPLQPYEYLFCATSLKFKHPGKRPEFKKIRNHSNQESHNAITQSNILETEELNLANTLPNEINQPEIFTMPDGNKYTYVELIKIFPSLSNKKVFKTRFPVAKR